MPEHLSCQTNWDPLLFASQNKVTMSVRLFGSLKEIEVLEEIWQEGFNSLMHLIENISKSGYSLYNKLSCTDLVMINRRFELRDGVALIRRSKASYDRAFCGGGEVIEKVIEHVNGQGTLARLPDVQELVDKMKNRGEPKGYPLLVDPSLMPLHNRGPATVDIYNFLTYEMTEGFTEQLLERLIYTLKGEWVSIAGKNDLLSKWLDGGTIASKKNKKPIDFVEYLRVCYSHILDYRRILHNIRSKRTGKVLNKKYNKKHANLVLYGNYIMVLSDLYGRLWKARKLKMLNPHLYIRYRQ